MVSFAPHIPQTTRKSAKNLVQNQHATKNKQTVDFERCHAAPEDVEAEQTYVPVKSAVTFLTCSLVVVRVTLVPLTSIAYVVVLMAKPFLVPLSGRSKPGIDQATKAGSGVEKLHDRSSGVSSSLVTIAVESWENNVGSAKKKKRK